MTVSIDREDKNWNEHETIERTPPPAQWRSSRRVTTNTPPRVLLAEDDKDIRELIAEALVADGYEVVAVPDGGRFLVRISCTYASERTYEEFDLIVSDIRMPVCNGLDILEALRKALWPTPTILMTSYADKQIRARAEALGAVLLEKPFTIDHLRTVAMSLTSFRAADMRPCTPTPASDPPHRDDEAK